MVDWAHLALGVVILWAPGLALVRAFAPELDWAKTLFVSVIVSLTVPPATTYILNVFFGVPVTAMNTVLIFLIWAGLGLAWLLPARLEGALRA